MIEILSNTEKFKRAGAGVHQAWNFEEVVGNITKLRGALESFLQLKFQEGEDLVEKKNLEDTLKYLKSIEAAYVAFDPKK